MDATYSTGNSSLVRLETLTASRVLVERLGCTNSHREEVLAALCTLFLAWLDLREPDSELTVRRGGKYMKETVSKKKGTDY